MSFFNELKRRNVFKVSIAYAVASWLLLQIVDLVLENINAPDWVMQVFMLGLGVGFPIAIIVAWAFELTPDGVRLEKNVEQNKSIARNTGHQLNRGIIMILAMAIVLLLTERFRDELFTGPIEETVKTEDISIDAGKPVAVDSNKSVAVLPFRDMSAAQDQAYFAEGIAEELLNALVKVEGLDVASRTSAFSLAGENLDIPAIAARLGVDHILEGSIRTSGQQVRVTAQLIEVSKDVHLWSETYDGSLDDIFKIQDEITGKIIGALKVQFADEQPPSSAQRLTASAEAYQYYLQGRHLWRQRNPPALREAIRLFGLAVELDPQFHQAWSNLAIAYLNLPDYDHSFLSEQGFELGLEAADKALAIAPQSTEALIIKADYKDLHCDLTGAADLYEKAIALNPKDPTAHHWYGILLAQAGRTQLALEHLQIAHRIDPLISAVIATEAGAYDQLGDFARAKQLLRQAQSLGFKEYELFDHLALSALYAGDEQQAKLLIKQSPVEADPMLMEKRQKFLEAIGDQNKMHAFEQLLGKAVESHAFQTMDDLDLLAALGSPYLFEYQADLTCPLSTDGIWAPSFKDQRRTPEFFELMERASFVAYWRKYGWPDDCASMDQTLAECK